MCDIRISFTSSAESLIERAKHEIEKAGGFFSGDSYSGNFQGKTPIGSISGSYQITGQEIHFSITKKPLLVSCRKIEKELRSAIG
jgi:hypothetical protein